MRLTTASSVSCTASSASLVFLSAACGDPFSTETSSDSARAIPATASDLAVGEVGVEIVGRLIRVRAARLLQPLFDGLQALLDMGERERAPGSDRWKPAPVAPIRASSSAAVSGGSSAIRSSRAEIARSTSPRLASPVAEAGKRAELAPQGHDIGAEVGEVVRRQPFAGAARLVGGGHVGTADAVELLLQPGEALVGNVRRRRIVKPLRQECEMLLQVGADIALRKPSAPAGRSALPSADRRRARRSAFRCAPAARAGRRCRRASARDGRSGLPARRGWPRPHGRRDRSGAPDRCSGPSAAPAG